MSSKEVGIVGLGKMGKNIALQMLSKGYLVVAYNRSVGPVNEVAARGARATGSVKELVEALMKPRTVWFMLTSGEVTSEAIREASKYMENGDTIIAGIKVVYALLIQLMTQGYGLLVIRVAAVYNSVPILHVLGGFSYCF